jgi:cation:H+ antiporter
VALFAELWSTVVVFVVGALVIAGAGTKLTRAVDRLADRTGVGEALAGAVLLGGATSIAGLVVTTVAAWEGDASLAISNAIGGIAVQTFFIVVADLAYRRANLERAAASLTNVFNTVLLVVLLTLVVIGVATARWSVLSIHPVTPVLLLAYVYGTRMSRTVGEDPMWQPRTTADTVAEEGSDDRPGTPAWRLWTRFLLLAVVTASAGWGVARSGLALAELTALSGTVVGAFLTSVASSLPELVTSVAAVRSGSLRLAIGGIVGGNTFDMLFVAVADVAYRDGSLYAEMRDRDLVLIGVTLLMSAILAAGLLRRQRARIGFEGVAIVLAYLTGVVAVSVMS